MLRFDINLEKKRHSSRSVCEYVCEWMTYRFIAFRYSPEMMMNIYVETRTNREVTATRQPMFNDRTNEK